MSSADFIGLHAIWTRGSRFVPCHVESNVHRVGCLPGIGSCDSSCILTSSWNEIARQGPDAVILGLCQPHRVRGLEGFRGQGYSPWPCLAGASGALIALLDCPHGALRRLHDIEWHCNVCRLLIAACTRTACGLRLVAASQMHRCKRDAACNPGRSVQSAPGNMQ